MREPDAWRRVVRGNFHLEGESLKRPPPGVPPDHPLIQDLVRKSFAGTVEFREAQVTGPDFLDAFLEAGRTMNPLNAFLAKAIGLPW